MEAPLRRHLLALALLSVILVTLGKANAVSIQDSLPSLVIDDESPPSSPAAAPAADQADKPAPTEATDKLDSITTLKALDSTVGSPSEQPAASPAAAKAEELDKETKLISYETKFEDTTNPKQTTTTEKPVESFTQASSETSTTNGDPIREITPTTTSQPTTTTSESSQTSTAAISGADKDINVLLANKDDSENDLTAASPVTSGAGSSVVIMDEKKDNAPSDSDAPVDTSKSESSGNNGDRFHYNLGNPEKPADETKRSETNSGDQSSLDGRKDPEPTTTEAAAPTTTTTTAVVAQSEVSKEQVALSESSSAQAPTEEAPLAKPVQPTIVKSGEGEQHTDKKVDTEEVVKSEAELKPKIDYPASSPGTTPEIVRIESTTNPSASTVPAANSEVGPKSLAPKDVAEKPQVEAPKEDSSATSVQPVAKVDDNKSAILPTVLAGAAGTALGAAASPGVVVANKEKSTPPAGTTKAAAGSTRKSTTDKWDRHSPSTAGTQSPTRRRPILPSIRRRFRPYNRFSPWGGSGGVDSYGPKDDEFSSPDGPIMSSTSSPTHKPRRRPGSSEPSSTKGSSSTASSVGSNSDDNDDESHSRPSGRRGSGSSGSKRRHHHNHHTEDSNLESRRRPHHGSHRDHHYNQHHHRHHDHHRGHDRDERPSHGFGFDRDPFDYPRPPLRPFPGDFGLFNSGQGLGAGVGSNPHRNGFDLLNPLSWLDEMSKPPRHPGRGPAPTPIGPPSHIGSAGRPSGNRPIPVEGDYNDENGPEHHDHRRPLPHHDGPGRQQGGRDDYDHGYQDCRDDYGHREPRPRPPYRPDGLDRPDKPDRPPYRPDGVDRPERPPYRPDVIDRPDRPPYRPDRPGRPNGDYDTYPPRPNRPYNRRDQTEQPVESNSEAESSTSEPAPSLYASRAPAPPGHKRIPSIFSPFESLFGTLDDELFGLRSSFIDSPLKPVSSMESSHTFDAVVSSPKISMPASQQAKESASSSPDSAKDSGRQPVAVSSLTESNNNNGKATIEEDETPIRATASLSGSSMADAPRSVELRTAVHHLSPCPDPHKSILCFFMHKQSPLMNLFHRL